MRARAHGAGLVALLLATLFALPAEARKNGIQVFGCWGCHRADATSTVVLTPDREPPFMPGDTVGFTATISYSSVKVGGIFVAKPDFGDLGAAAGQGLTLSDGALTHSSPKPAANGAVTFEFSWQAPAEPGAVALAAYVLAGNSNGQNTGDAPGEGGIEFTYGCQPADFYFDADGDGHGAVDADKQLGCADQPAPKGYAPVADDCDDARDFVHPGAAERCNGKDDDCDEEIDEDTMPQTLWPDPDGDGYYGVGAGPTIVGCLPLDGYADEPGDCDPNEGSRYPGAEEVCNFFDDNCDGRIDELVRPRCGVGRCERESGTCEPDGCVPGTPVTETCNGLDDDCNEVMDDGEPCKAGEACLGIRCVPIEGAESGGASGSGGSATAETGGSGAVSGSAGMTSVGGTSAGGASGATMGGNGAVGDGGSTMGSAAAGSAGQTPAPVALRPGNQVGCRVDGTASPLGARELTLALLASLAFRTRRRRRATRS